MNLSKWLSPLVMELDQLDREYPVVQGRDEAAQTLESVGEQLFRLAGKVKRGEV